MYRLLFLIACVAASVEVSEETTTVGPTEAVVADVNSTTPQEPGVNQCTAEERVFWIKNVIFARDYHRAALLGAGCMRRVASSLLA